MTHSPIDAPLLAASAAPVGDWPMAQPFSRRLGEPLCGAAYAQAIETPTANFDPPLFSSFRTLLAVAALAVLAATANLFWGRQKCGALEVPERMGDGKARFTWDQTGADGHLLTVETAARENGSD